MSRRQASRAGEPISNPSLATLDQLRKVAWLLDNSIRLPGGFRIGVEAVLGLIPFVGDAIGVLLSAYIVTRAAKLDVPGSVLARMLLNIAIEGVIGLVPVFGDVFDAVWKANQRNVDLLAKHVEQPRKTRRTSRWFVVFFLLCLITLIALIVTGAVLLLRWAWQFLVGSA